MSCISTTAPRRILAAGLILLVIPFIAAAQQKLIRLRSETIRTERALAPAKDQATRMAERPVSGLILIQLEGTVTPEWRAELRQHDVDLLQYVPDDAFVARAAAVRFSDLRRLSFVRWVGDFRPDHKLHAKLRQSALQGGAARTAVSVLVAADSTPAQTDGLRQGMHEASRAVRYPFGTILRGQASPVELNRLTASDRVLWIEPAPQMKLVDEVSSAIVAGPGTMPNHTAMMESGYDGSGVTVAVADSGLDSGEIEAMHPDIAGRVSALFYYGQPGQLEDASDEHGHGTHVAGIIAGNGILGEKDENDFLYGLGVAPGAQPGRAAHFSTTRATTPRRRTLKP